MENQSNGQEPQDRGEIKEKPDRNIDGTFAKGREKTGGKKLGSKNKPKFLDEIEEMLDEMAEGKDYTYRQALKKEVLRKLIIDGDTTLLKEYWQQRDGTPTQRIRHSGTILSELSEEDKNKLDKLFMQDETKTINPDEEIKEETTAEEIPSEGQQQEGQQQE